MKKIAISQSNYLPWKGYFDLINSVDEFIILDTVQFTKRDWRNRNKIKTYQGLKWITLPVMQKGNYFNNIIDMEISDSDWIVNHLNIIENSYRKSPYFKEVYEFIKNMFSKCENLKKLSQINKVLITEICFVLQIRTKIVSSEDFKVTGEPNFRLIDICKAVNATHYLSGPAAKSYLDEKLFKENGLYVEWMNYDGYPEYNQQFGEFIHQVSVIDLLFNVGLENAKNYINTNNR
ncbi:WbqC family protein [Solibacillus daqui]|uniref:WbqC family protein n=1 Tax=Solibacillus daqui TaxID=2912187 RepID=UPI00236660EE|nr:WbqC family protein [Solibacillus daqui]